QTTIASQPADGRTFVGDLRKPIGVDIAKSDPPERRVAGCGVVWDGPNAAQSKIVEDGIGSKEADVATDLHRTQGGGPDRAIELAKVDARAAEANRRAAAV